MLVDFEACSAGDCHYENWIDEPLSTRARGAIKERIRAHHVKHRATIWKQLQLIHKELSADDSSEEDEEP